MELIETPTQYVVDHSAVVGSAWLEGLVAAREGRCQSSNPYIGQDQELAKEWDAGWEDEGEVN